MKIIGLTGGIASGKSSVAKALRALGAPVIDADQLARDVVEPGQPAFEDIRRTWPEVIVDGRIDRKKLGDLVFEDAAARAKLESFTHPRIAEASALAFGAALEAGHAVAYYEAALLVETGRYEGFDGLIVVSLSPGVQLERLMARDGITEPKARVRIAAQLPLAEKVKRATWVIDNSGTPLETAHKVRELHETLVAP